ncbi:hypothetical protein [Archangium lipolyticum]|uniref:hypothetical protein n=1 Tax=Archangium lipolyticum TaxID=2970465 RepID=UPI00214CB7E6|nr:hypothetical protein [Archangium lipolyticum]
MRWMCRGRTWLPLLMLVATAVAAQPRVSPRVALVRVKDTTGLASESALRSTLQRALERSSQFQAVGGRPLREAARALHAPAGRWAEPEYLPGLATRLSFDTAVTALLTRRGAGFRLVLRAVEPASGQGVALAFADLGKPRLRAEAADRLVQALARKLPTLSAAPPTASAPEPTLVADAPSAPEAPAPSDDAWAAAMSGVDFTQDAPEPATAQPAVEVGGRVSVEHFSYPEHLGDDRVAGRDLAELGLQVRGTTAGATIHGSFLMRRDFADPSRDRFDVEEAYFELKGTRWAFRAGRLLTSWGAASLYNPTDVLDPVDLRDPLAPEKRGAWMARVSAFFGPVLLEGYFLPVPEAHLLPLPEAIGPDGAFVARSRWVRGRLPLPEGIPAHVTVTAPRVPSARVAHSQGGVRLVASVLGADLSLGFVTLMDRMPTLRADILPVPGPPPGLEVTITGTHERLHVATLDVEYTLGKLRLVAEAAAFLTRDRRAQDPFREDPYAIGVVGGDYQVGPFFQDHSLHVFLELTHSQALAGRLSDDALGRLRRPVPSGLLARVAYEAGPDLRFEVAGALSRKGDDGFANPRVEYVLFDRVKARLGYLWLFGSAEEGSFAPFRHNSRLEASMEASF